MQDRSLLRAKILAERFEKNVSRRNEPLEAFRKRDEFKQFEQKTAAIFKEQVQYVAKNLQEIPIWDNEELSASAIEAHVGQWLDAKMPQFSEKMKYETVHDLFYASFIWSIQASYERIGAKLILKKASYTQDFELTNPDYLNALADDANYLLTTKSKGYDQTTKDKIINTVRKGRLNRDTYDEISSDLQDQFDQLGPVRAFMIANTETANAFGTANQAFMYENGVEQKEWVTAGSNPCAICDGNEADGPISVDSTFSSGDTNEPAHPNCECYVNSVGLDLTQMSNDELDSLILWDGS